MWNPKHRDNFSFKNINKVKVPINMLSKIIMLLRYYIALFKLNYFSNFPLAIKYLVIEV